MTDKDAKLGLAAVCDVTPAMNRNLRRLAYVLLALLSIAGSWIYYATHRHFRPVPVVFVQQVDQAISLESFCGIPPDVHASALRKLQTKGFKEANLAAYLLVEGQLTALLCMSPTNSVLVPLEYGVLDDVEPHAPVTSLEVKCKKTPEKPSRSPDSNEDRQR
jgi:hypothetical protein